MIRNKLFNNEIETSIRLLVSICHFKNDLDMQKLIYFDFLTLHYGNVDEAACSLHPANPYHITEAYNKRELVQKSLGLLLKKGLVNVNMTKWGITYSKNSFGISFLETFESEYYKELVDYSGKVMNTYERYSTEELDNLYKVTIFFTPF